MFENNYSGVNSSSKLREGKGWEDCWLDCVLVSGCYNLYFHNEINQTYI